MRTLRKILDQYEWIHTWIGIAGNVLFVLGSIMFMSEQNRSVGTWLFIVGSTAMLIGNVGRALVDVHRGSDKNGERARQTVGRPRRLISAAD